MKLDLEPENLTKGELVSILLSVGTETERGMEMKGNVRAKGTCPECQGPFEQVKKLGFICPQCKITPQRFYVDLSYQGNRVRIFSDKHGETLDTYQRALNLLAHINYELTNHIFDPSKYVAGEVKKYLFENLIEKWLTTKKQGGLALSYIPKLEQFKRDYFSHFKGHDVRDTRTSHVHEFFYQLPERLKSKTKKNIMAALRNFYSWLHKMEYVERMPVFPVIETEQPQWKWVDVDMQTQIITEIPEEDRYIYVFLALHGCRPSEARALKVKDVSFEHSSITISRNFAGKCGNVLTEHTKTRRRREIPINPEMTEPLRMLCRDKLPEAFLFVNPRTNKPYAKSTYQEIWQNACTQAKVNISSYEGLRHSFASQRVSRGVDIYLISKVLGHTDIRTTQRYSHTNLESLKNVMSINDIYRLKPDRHQTVTRAKKHLKISNKNK